MNRWTVFMAAFLLMGTIAVGCSGGGNPVTPAAPGELTGASVAASGQTHLWGYYDVYIDIPTQTATAVLNRNVNFAANVVQFINGKPANLAFNIIGTPMDPGGKWVDVDIDVSISHPFPGLTQYNGYDVRGVFVGNASKTLKYNAKCKYAAHNSTTDQEMYDYNKTTGDTHTGLVGMPDGYTRWFNPVEFTTPGLFGYTQGIFASPGYAATGTLNPYKYFADGLGVTDNLWNFLTTTTKNGVFTAGSTNTRNYYLRFPTPSPGVKYGYIIVANWESETVHPANAPEEVGLSVAVTPDLYYVSSSDKGGKLILDLYLQTTWGQVPSTIFVESTVLSTKYQFTSTDMTPVGGGTNYSTYHVEIPADNITGNSSTVYHEFWVIPQYDAFNYKNSFGVTNTCGNDKLAAFFRYELYVSPVAYNKPPKVTAGVSGNNKPNVGSTEVYTVTASDPDGDPISYSWTILDGTTPVTGWTDLPGSPPGSLTITWGTVPGANSVGKKFNVTCKVTDGKSSPVSATPLEVEMQCPSPAYYTSFDSTDPEKNNWTTPTTSTYWECNWFSGSINSKNNTCYEWGCCYNDSNHWVGRTGGFPIPSCWPPTDTLQLKIAHELSHEDYWDTAAITRTTANGTYGTQMWSSSYGFAYTTLTLNMPSGSWTPGSPIYINWWHGGWDGCCNDINFGNGYTVHELTID